MDFLPGGYVDVISHEMEHVSNEKIEAKMRDSRMLANEYSGKLTSDSLMFFLWLGTSGVLLFIIGSYLV